MLKVRNHASGAGIHPAVALTYGDAAQPLDPIEHVTGALVVKITRRICLALAAASAFAGLTTAASAQEASVERGQVLAYTCLGCHGIRGYRNAYPSYRVPKLGGQSGTYLEIALQAYKSGERDHPTMMAQAASLSDQDIADLAAYFVSKGEIEVAESTNVPVPEQAALCTACHGQNGVGLAPEWPTLAGQHEDYLVDALLQYQKKTVSVRNNAVMAGLIGALTKKEIKALARYYASFDGLYTTKEE